MSNISGVILDLSGVLYDGDEALPGAARALERLAELGLPVRYVTNTTRRTGRDLLRHLDGMGLAVDARGLTPYLLIHPDLRPEFADRPAAEPNAVLVADAGEGFTYAAMNRAFRLLMDGAPLLAVARNRYFQDRDGPSLDAGPFVAALEFAAGIESEIIGKPAAPLFLEAAASMGCHPASTVMVGDDVDSDVNGALAAGLQAILVRTGKYRDGDEERMYPGGTVLADISAAVEWIAARA